MIKVQELIYSDDATAGSGQDASSPVRRLIKIYSKEGELVAENDPCNYSIEKVNEVLKRLLRDFMESSELKLTAEQISQGHILSERLIATHSEMRHD